MTTTSNPIARPAASRALGAFAAFALVAGLGLGQALAIAAGGGGGGGGGGGAGGEYAAPVAMPLIAAPHGAPAAPPAAREASQCPQVVPAGFFCANGRQVRFN